MLVADPRGILTVIAVLMCWALAIVLFRVSISGSVARKLAVLLIFEGFTLGSSTIIFLFAAGPQLDELYPQLQMIKAGIHFFCDSVMIALYPPFLAAALNTRLTRPFARKGMQIGLAVYAAGLYLILLFISPGQGILMISLSLVAVFVFALVASIQAWLTSKGQARTRARIFVMAFGFRDLCWAFLYFHQVIMVLGGMMEAEAFALDLVYIMGTLVAVPLIAYGILKVHLFDIDLKIRWTIKQSTFAAMVVVIAAVFSEGVEFFVSAEMGETWGLVAAGAALLFIKPLQGIAERFVSFLMPNTENTPEYARSQKTRVYESALEEAMLDGGISDKERSLLVRLRDSLEISEAEADRIEYEVINAAPDNVGLA